MQFFYEHACNAVIDGSVALTLMTRKKNIGVWK